MPLPSLDCLRSRTDTSVCAAAGLMMLASVGCAPPKPDLSSGPTSSISAHAARNVSNADLAPGAFMPPNTEILAREPWKYTTAEGEILRTTNYRIYTTAQDKVIRERLGSFLEHALAHYRTAIVPLPAPTTRLDTYLMNNRPQWERLTKQLMGPQAETLLNIPRGGYASRGIGVYYNIGLFDTLAIAGHEGWHQFTQKTFAEPLPVWLEEGLATYMEGHRWEGSTPVFRGWSNVQRYDQLRKASSEGKLLPLSELLDSRPQDFLEFSDDRVLTFYAQLWALVHYLREGENGRYRAGLDKVLLDASAGRISEGVQSSLGSRGNGSAHLAARNGPGVFLAYFDQDLSQAEAGFAAFITALTQSGQRGVIVEGRSPVVSGTN